MARPSPCPPLGDVDGDGQITEADIELIGRHRAGLITLTPEQQQRADVNGDGQLTIADVLSLGQYLANLSETFPACAVAPPASPTGSNWLPLVALGAGALLLSSKREGKSGSTGGDTSGLVLGLIAALLLLKGKAQRPAPPPEEGPSYDNLSVGLEVSNV